MTTLDILLLPKEGEHPTVLGNGRPFPVSVDGPTETALVSLQQSGL